MQRVIPPTLAGDRVTVREFSADDAALVRSVVNDPLIPLITTLPAGADETEVEAYIERQRSRARNGEGCQFVIAETSTGTAVGQIGLTYRDPHRERANIGYWISPAHRGRGFAASALELVTAWAAGLDGMQRLELYAEPWNVASWRAAESVGFVREGLLRRWERVGDERRDMYM